MQAGQGAVAVGYGSKDAGDLSPFGMTPFHRSPGPVPWHSAAGRMEPPSTRTLTIKIGTTGPELDVVKSRRGVAFDAVGLLPASIFHRIYISHSGGFVVLNPGE
jgi:hypothetical protein